MYKLRELERRDIPTINKWHNDVNLAKNLGGGYRFIGEEVDRAWFDRYLQSRNNSVRLAVVDENDVIVGCVYFLNIDNINLSADLHIMIGEKENRGKGIGSYAVKALVEHAFYNLNLRRIQLEVLEYNTAARALYRKIGFIEEGIKRKAVYKNGEYVDELIMALLKEDYYKQE